MKRRDFIKVSSAAGIAGLVGPGYASMAHAAPSKTNGFDLHPFIKEHPEAVFINLTSVEEKTDSEPIYDAAYKLASEMFVKTTSGKGYLNSTKVNCKPNWTCAGRPGSDPESKLGITTDLNYIEGFLKGVKNRGPQNYSLRECACPQFWDSNGYTAMAERNEIGWDVVKALVAHNRQNKPHYKEVKVSMEKRGTPPPGNVYGATTEQKNNAQE